MQKKALYKKAPVSPVGTNPVLVTPAKKIVMKKTARAVKVAVKKPALVTKRPAAKPLVKVAAKKRKTK